MVLAVASAKNYSQLAAFRFTTGTATVAAAIGVQCLVCIAWRFYYVYEDKRRDKITDAMNLSAEEYEAQGQGVWVRGQDRPGELLFFRSVVLVAKLGKWRVLTAMVTGTLCKAVRSSTTAMRTGEAWSGSWLS